jgi:Type II secretion system (T2SS), protein N
VKRAFWPALLAAVAFAVIFMARIPAAWVVPQATAARFCTSLDGTVWSGNCAGLTFGGRALGDLSWDLHPLRLVAGRLGAHVTLAHSTTSARGDVELGFGGRITLRNLLVDGPLDAALVPGVPTTLRGTAHVDLVLAQIQHGIIRELQGRIEAHDLEDRSGNDTALGSYVVSFPGGSSPPTGTVRDLDGPLAVEGTLRLTAQPGFELEGFIAPRKGAAPEIVNNIRLFGSPDASGRRPFSMSGTF